MKLRINFSCTVLLAVIFTLSHLQCGDARTLATAEVLKSTTSTMKIKNTNIQNDTTVDFQDIQPSNATTVVIQRSNATTVDGQDIQHSNETAVTTMPAPTKSLEISQPTASSAVAHIVRIKRETEVTMPYDFNTMHLPCDLDQNGRSQVIDSYPNHCIWVWNNKYVHEGFFRVFKTYQLEAFFFGQYYERLKRFEIDPHSWDYTNTGV